MIFIELRVAGEKCEIDLPVRHRLIHQIKRKAFIELNYQKTKPTYQLRWKKIEKSSYTIFHSVHLEVWILYTPARDVNLKRNEKKSLNSKEKKAQKKYK